MVMENNDSDYLEALDTGGVCSSTFVLEAQPAMIDTLQRAGLAALHASVIWTGPDFGCLHWAAKD